MGLKDNLSSFVSAILKTQWQETEARVVPSTESLVLKGNEAKYFSDAVVLYADIDNSTGMVENYSWRFCAEVYKNYLHCASQIIKSEGGVITAYDGDRVMAIFIGDYKNTRAVRSALRINAAVHNIINVKTESFYSLGFKLSHHIGIDRSELRAARVGVKGDNDLVWIGSSANTAAKLCGIDGKTINITEPVYRHMLDETKYSGTKNMWQPINWNGRVIYQSSYFWEVPN